MKKITTIIIVIALLAGFTSYSQTDTTLKFNTDCGYDAMRNSTYIFQGTLIKGEPFQTQKGSKTRYSKLIKVTNIFRNTDGKLKLGTVQLIDENTTFWIHDDGTIDENGSITIGDGGCYGGREENGIYFCTEYTNASHKIANDNEPLVLHQTYGIRVELREMVDMSKLPVNRFEGFTPFDVLYLNKEDFYRDMLKYPNITIPDSLLQKKSPIENKVMHSLLSEKKGHSKNDINLSLSIANDIMVGSNLEFDILIAADDINTYLDNCVMDIYFSNNVGNYLASSINIYTYAYFFDTTEIVYTPFDYNSNIVHIQYGSDSGLTAWNRVEVPTSFEPFLHISVPVDDCYQNTFCSFQNLSFVYLENYYTSLPDDDIIFYPIQYLTTDYSGHLNKTYCYYPPEILSFTDTLYAGTYYQNTLTPNMSKMIITGTNFGTVPGEVYFRNADNGAPFDYLPLNHYDILSWTDNTIILQIPGLIDSTIYFPGKPTPAGGYFYIKTITNEYAYSTGVQTGKVYFRYALLNRTYDSPYDKYRLDFKKVNVDGSLTFLLDTSITHNPDPKLIPALKRALADWVCETRVNLKIGGADSGHIGAPGYSVIYMADVLDVSHPGFIGETTQTTVTCNNSSMASIRYSVVAGIQIGFKRSPASSTYPLAYYWLDTLFDVNLDFVPANAVDEFELFHHEFGHASGLAHLSDSTDLMYYGQRPGWRQEWYRRGIKYYDAQGGIDVVKKSAYFNSYSSGCSGYNMPESPSGSCLPGWDLIPKINSPYFKYKIYPNPLDNNLLNVSYELTKDSPVKFELFDIAGREVYLFSENKNAGEHIDKLNLDGIATGIYFIKIVIGDIQDTQKLVKIR